MTYTNKKRLREEVKEGNWTIIWIGAVMPCEFLDEEVELMYEDMDGHPCVCEAYYTYDRKDTFYHKPYFSRVSDGSKMVNCIAWRKLSE